MSHHRKIFLYSICSLSLLISSCGTTPSYYRTPSEQAAAMLQEGVTSNENIYKNNLGHNLPNAVKNAMIPGNSGIKSTGSENKNNQSIYDRRFNIVVNNVPADLFFKNLGKETSYSILIDPKISGTITLNLKNVSILQLFDALHDAYGYDFEKTAFGFEVLPAKLETRTFHVNYLYIQRSTNSNTEISSSGLSSTPATTTGDVTNMQNNLSSTPTSQTPVNASTSSTRSQVYTSSVMNFWADLTISLKALVGNEKGRSVIVNPASGTIVVKGYPDDIRMVQNFLDQIQSSMSREVVLEVKLLEVQLNDSFNSGIDWHVFGFNQPDNSAFVNGSPDTNAQLTTITTTHRSFQNIISLLEQQGNVQTIANPRVLTINNQQSVIRIGTEQFYVTGITDNITNNGIGSVITSASVGLTPFFSGVILDITPQISSQGDILLHLHPVISDVSGQKQVIDLGQNNIMTLPLAKNEMREYDSIVRAKNNQVILVGGLTQNNLNENINSTPGLSKIPFLGMLFRSTYQNSAKTELVILLKPTVIGEENQTMASQLPLEESRINELDRGFHNGSLPEIFGNEAESPKYAREVNH